MRHIKLLFTSIVTFILISQIGYSQTLDNEVVAEKSKEIIIAKGIEIENQIEKLDSLLIEEDLHEDDSASSLYS